MTPYVVDSQAPPLSVRRSGSREPADASEPKAVRGREGSVGSSSIISTASSRPKHAHLKRVSFGSSKGSMVETVIFDNDEITTYRKKLCSTAAGRANEEPVNVTPPSKVRVTYYESQKPHYVTTPDSSELSFNLFTLSSTMASPEDVQKYISMCAGTPNPFRPEGELSKESETLVRQVQTGVPLSSIRVDNEARKSEQLQNAHIETNAVPSIFQLNKLQQGSSATTPSVVEVQHGIVVPPSSPSNVEQVTIKKKPKCHCCVIL